MKKPTRTILLVEDDKDILDALKLLLRDADYAVVATDNGKYLEDLSRNKLPDIILMDILLSGKDGRDIIRKLKNQEHTKSIPVILISAYPEAKTLWKQSGADDFLEKPFDIDVLLSMIKNHLPKNPA